MTTPVADAPSLEFGHYLSVVRRRWPVVLLGLLLGLGAAFAYVQLATRSVTATAVVRINVISTTPFDATRAASDLIDPRTEEQTAVSSTVMTNAADDLDTTRTPQQIRANTTATLVPDTTVMRISYTANNRADAEAGADAVANQYLNYRTDQADSRLDAIVTKLSDQRDVLRDDLLAANTALANAKKGSGDATQAESDRQLLNLELDSLLSQINTFQGIDTTGGTLLMGSGDNATTISPSRNTLLATGAAFGLILGVLGAFAVASLDRRLRDQYDIRKAGGGEVISELHGRLSSMPSVGDDADEIRSLRERLLAALPAEAQILAVADLTPGSTPSDVAVNLAAAFAGTGRKVNLAMPDVDPDFLAAVIKAFDLKPVNDSSGVRSYQNTLLTVIVPVSGALPLEAGEAFVARSLADPAHLPDLTLIALPPNAERSQLLAAGRLGHSLILVVAKGGTTRKRVERLAEELAAVGATVHGTVLVPRGRRLEQNVDGPVPAELEESDSPAAHRVSAAREPGRRSVHAPVTRRPTKKNRPPT
ncbi:hypothetical protein NOCA2230035 [metagenome]|uniref:Lipopolysaccharide biosynthesis protein n=1 Tax=metagenome TaxID=256318 RepID=A0A2P2BZE0_9ZZZZ